MHAFGQLPTREERDREHAILLYLLVASVHRFTAIRHFQFVLSPFIHGQSKFGKGWSFSF